MKKIILAACMAATLPTFAQQDGGVTFSGSIQSDMLVFPENDKEIGTNYGTNKDFLTNTYANFNLQSKFIFKFRQILNIWRSFPFVKSTNSRIISLF